MEIIVLSLSLILGAVEIIISICQCDRHGAVKIIVLV